MLHEYKLLISYEEIEEIIEKLLLVDISNTYYEEPIEVKKTDNGYGYSIGGKKDVELYIYGDPEEVPNLPQLYFDKIEKSLQLPRSAISYRLIDEQWNMTFEDVSINEEWVIQYQGSTQSYDDKKVLLFDPQGAFGTGLHATTQDCVRMIVDEDFSNFSVLDLGTGSGILSIAASIRGAKSVCAIDIQPVTREIIHNCQLNDINNVTVVEADLFADYSINESYDWIFINIGAEETVLLCQQHQLMSKGDAFIVSGIVDWNEQKVVSYFIQNGYTIKKRAQQEEWVTLMFLK
ncbi:50S ribosomal protein L11 methyltransferase [Bacillus alkalicellulosilyticus]|uniref:50S ribosomal protein L11 methyltransferase n=1 Tax=Alkalihalobacterium alkalicellulosilyticum TaxID=1912214 RepID=UPI000998BF67|nr:50S ribosomal protein L11 methyltransferase [Bacillus alkalicellulosilyticus]